MPYGRELVSTVLPLAPGVIETLQTGADVLNLGCGRGHAINLMAQSFPRSRFSGWGVAEDGIAAARETALRRGLINVRFSTRDVATLDETEAYHLITAFDVMQVLGKPERVLPRIVRALRRDGTFLMVDIAASSDVASNRGDLLGTPSYAGSPSRCTTVSLTQGGPGSVAMVDEEKARATLRAVGFRSIEVRYLYGDAFHAYYIARKVN